MYRSNCLQTHKRTSSVRGPHLMNPKTSFLINLGFRQIHSSVIKPVSLCSHALASEKATVTGISRFTVYVQRGDGASSWTHYRRTMSLSVPVDGTQSVHSSCLFWKLGAARGCHDVPRPVAGSTICCRTQCVF